MMMAGTEKTCYFYLTVLKYFFTYNTYIVCDINLESRQVREDDHIGHICLPLDIYD